MWKNCDNISLFFFPFFFPLFFLSSTRHFFLLLFFFLFFFPLNFSSTHVLFSFLILLSSFFLFLPCHSSKHQNILLHHLFFFFFFLSPFSLTLRLLVLGGIDRDWESKSESESESESESSGFDWEGFADLIEPRARCCWRIRLRFCPVILSFCYILMFFCFAFWGILICKGLIFFSLADLRICYRFFCVWIWKFVGSLGICYRFFCVWIWKFVGRAERRDENWWFIKGNLIIFGRAQRIKIKTRMSLLFMDLQSSINSNARFFTNIKRSFFQKVAFYTYQTLFSGWLFRKRAFWASNAETNGHLLYTLYIKIGLVCESCQMYRIISHK